MIFVSKAGTSRITDEEYAEYRRTHRVEIKNPKEGMLPAEVVTERFEICKACEDSTNGGHGCRWVTGECCWGGKRAQRGTRCPHGKW